MNDDLVRDASTKLAQMVHEGARTMPSETPNLVCKPTKIEPWRIFKIMNEFVEGFDVLRRYGLAASFFGSERATFDHKIYQDAEALAAKLSKKGFAIITGGAQGVMQAANKGAFEAGGASIGLNINLPKEQHYNPYLTDQFSFDHFFVRKVMLTYASEVYIYFPGGFGTLDEFFEIITLVQTEKIRKVPIVLFGRAYWVPLITFIEESLYVENRAINREELSLFKLVDSVDEAFEYIVSAVKC